jgi:DNA-binding response OmpR family regulator
MARDDRAPLGKILLRRKSITQESLDRALDAQKRSAKPLASHLLDEGVVSETDALRALSEQFGVPGVDLSQVAIDTSHLDLVPREVAEARSILPLLARDDRLFLAMASPDDRRVIDELEFVTGRKVYPYVAVSTTLAKTISAAYDAKESGLSHFLGPRVPEATLKKLGLDTQAQENTEDRATPFMGPPPTRRAMVDEAPISLGAPGVVVDEALESAGRASQISVSDFGDIREELSTVQELPRGAVETAREAVVKKPLTPKIAPAQVHAAMTRPAFPAVKVPIAAHPPAPSAPHKTPVVRQVVPQPPRGEEPPVGPKPARPAAAPAQTPAAPAPTAAAAPTQRAAAPQAASAAAPPTAPGSAPRVGAKASDTGKLVLVVDDEEEIRKLVVRLLTDLGHRVVEADRGLVALRMVKENTPDLIVLDAMLPEVHGFDIAKRIKTSEKYGAIPIVMMSAVYRGRGMEEDLKANYGIEEYVEKPFRLADLKAAVNRALTPAADAAKPRDPEAVGAEALKLLEGGIEAYRRGDIEGALEMLRQGVHIDPLAYRLRYHLGLLYGKKGQIYDGIGELERAAELNPTAFPALKNLAVLYEKAGFKNKALDTWSRCVEAAPDAETRATVQNHISTLR